MGAVIMVTCAAAVGAGLALIILTALHPAATPGAPGGAGGSRVASRRSRESRRPVEGSIGTFRLPRRIALSAGIGIAVALATSWPVLLPVGAGAAWFLPTLLRSDGGAGAQSAKVEAIATFAEMLRDTLNAAAGIGQAICAAARCASDPIAAEALELAAAIEGRTVPIERALRTFGDQLADPTGDLVVLALMYAAGNSARDLAALLSDLAYAARAEVSMRARVEIARARTRTAVRLITGVTLGLGIVLYLFDEPFLSPYDTGLGQLALLAISCLFATGFAWLARLSRPSEQPRLLPAEPASTDSGEIEMIIPASTGLLPGPRHDRAAHAYTRAFSAGGR